MRPNNEILIDYLDKKLDQNQSAELESTLLSDRRMQEEYQYLLLARETIQLNARHAMPAIPVCLSMKAVH